MIFKTRKYKIILSLIYQYRKKKIDSYLIKLNYIIRNISCGETPANYLFIYIIRIQKFF